MEAFDLIVQSLPALAKGAVLTIKFAVASMVLGLIVGLIVAIVRIGNNRSLAAIAQGYVSVMRGTPLLVQMFVVYYGLPGIGISLDPTSAGILTLTLNARISVRKHARRDSRHRPWPVGRVA